MEKSEILLEIKKAEDAAKRIIAEAEENRKIRLAELDLEMEKIFESRKRDLDLDIDKQQKLEIDKIYMEKQRAISEGVREIEKVRDQALGKKDKAVESILIKFMRYIDEL
ncbi:MAG: hypothetical protein APG08_00339 [Candidatus Methanofastidiosum methylothiophilum]|jgi:vacuolar-type H+-ATPase subunit H|uniref:V-type ATP synthase subunit H n=1 Tax=Candidatus Methanofastidiosum methylothiophilum TaxID=1705564 RepID=A0A150JLW9_9EURY|nr:MAG: hypothetical protein AN188_00345 [Candidatus Methanofastidiosum methylthiophilus]OQC51587.1 MAG: hypothetical protein BWX56_00888 [Euryarchaeota archaeon ADurb.Bin023]HNV94030.1 hypothetical protein [Methanofastidiosum sp.]KYC57458.1 MAG: hypothetical protein APG08_00339 [Candidatus Methanofastidiosum methylthiophilus]KYC58245.1 MAG: hypothetical protein APG09_00524 [Candidatus Methanofastidiosum methylthiophilus]